MGLTNQDQFRATLRARSGAAAGSDEEIEASRLRWLELVLAGGIRVHQAASLMVLTPAVEKVRPMLVARHWQLLRINGWHGFVLGDQPVTLFSQGRIAPSIGFGTPNVQMMMPIDPATLLVISDVPREAVLEVKVQPRQLGLEEPVWAFANRIAWLTSKRYVDASRLSHLQATELSVHPGDRRSDIHAAADDELDAQAESELASSEHARR